MPADCGTHSEEEWGCQTEAGFSKILSDAHRVHQITRETVALSLFLYHPAWPKPSSVPSPIRLSLVTVSKPMNSQEATQLQSVLLPFCANLHRYLDYQVHTQK